MNIVIDKTFEKDTDKISDKDVLIKIVDCIEAVQSAGSLSMIKNIKKMKGARNYYRIRIGDYRAGIIVEGLTVEFIRFLHRKDIYQMNKYFP
jgi:mRNA interferase RelE/StbE